MTLKKSPRKNNPSPGKAELLQITKHFVTGLLAEDSLFLELLYMRGLGMLPLLSALRSCEGAGKKASKREKGN